MQNQERCAIVITHMGRRNDIIEMPWLDTEYCIDQSDSMILSNEGWRAVADGDPTIWEALQQKLLVGFYMNQPQLIVVIGHPADAGGDDELNERQAEVRRIVQRIQSLLLPASVMGLWTDECGALQEILEPAECGERELGELQLMH